MTAITQSPETKNHTEKMLRFNWCANSSLQDIVDFKQELLAEVDTIISQKPESVLINIRNSRGKTGTPLDSWISTEFTGKLAAAGVKKLAVLTDKNYIIGPAEKDPMQDSKEKKMRTGYFDRNEYAVAWLEK